MDDTLTQIRNVLDQAIQNNLQAGTEALQAQDRDARASLAANAARSGALYSGGLTEDFTRQTAATQQQIQQLAGNALQNRFQVWGNIQSTLDKISSLNEAAQYLRTDSVPVASVETPGIGYDPTNLMNWIRSLQP